MTDDVALFLAQLLAQQQLAVGAPGFADTALLVIKAQEQLDAIIDEATAAP